MRSAAAAVDSLPLGQRIYALLAPETVFVCEVSQASASIGLFVHVDTSTRAKPKGERSCRCVTRAGDQSRSADCGTPWAFDRHNFLRETLRFFAEPFDRGECFSAALRASR